MSGTICIVDDEPEILKTLGGILTDEGYQVVTAQDGAEALNIIQENAPDVMLLDIWMPRLDGLEVLQRVRRQFPSISVIMMSGHGSVESAVKATRLGAYDYLEKPLDMDRVTILVRNAVHHSRLEEENLNLRVKITRHSTLVGSSSVMEKLRQQIAAAAAVHSRVLISGENGTGKELVARAIHQQSSRRGHPFVEINCAAIPDTLIESELFGHERGAFTGAVSQKRGKFDLADGGTLFLDEIGDMSIATQAKILRVLEEQRFSRVGGGKSIKVNVRVIAASNKDLRRAIHEGHFREDLFYRVNVLPIDVPPLRARREDIPTLTRHFLKLHAEEQGVRPKEIVPDALDVLVRHDWPGNVRELRNQTERIMIMAPHDTLGVDDVMPFMPAGEAARVGPMERTDSLRAARLAFEREYIATRLRENDWNVAKTAEDLKVERSHLHRKIKLLNVAPDSKSGKPPRTDR